MNNAYMCPNKACTVGKSAFLLPSGTCKCGTERIQVAIIHLLYESEDGIIPGSLLAGNAYVRHPRRRWNFCCEPSQRSAQDANFPKHYTTVLGAATCPDCLTAYRELDKKKLQIFREYCEVSDG